MYRAVALFCLLATRAPACEVALVLAIDISGSIDAGEYIQQSEGLALALRDPSVSDVLVQEQAALTVMHWSGTGRQSVVLGWQRMETTADVAVFADRVMAAPRAFDASDTAVGEAISFATSLFDAVPDCARKVIDVSGDGPENAGFTVGRARRDAQKKDVQINAIAIEDMGASVPITNFYREWVITHGGFVMTARGLQDYPRAMREKLLRELTKPAS